MYIWISYISTSEHLGNYCRFLSSFWIIKLIGKVNEMLTNDNYHLKIHKANFRAKIPIVQDMPSVKNEHLQKVSMKKWDI